MNARGEAVRFRKVCCAIAIGLVAWAKPATAQTDYADAGLAESGHEEVVAYDSAFFQQYAPDTALDMVEQLPGFQIDDGGDKRGLGGSAGNVLIDRRRPSAKQDSPTALLRRLPASHVKQIELIRGQVSGVENRGHPVLANLVLFEDAPAAVRWDASFRMHTNVSPIRSEGSISLTDRWMGVDYSTGISGFKGTFGDEGTNDIFDGSGAALERRFDDSSGMNYTRGGYLNASGWLGETQLNVNASVGTGDRYDLLSSHRIQATGEGSSHDEFFGEDTKSRHFEVGTDAARRLTQELAGKLIFLVYTSEQQKRNDQRVQDSNGNQSFFRMAGSSKDTAEAISRVELDWTGWADHALEANLEVAYNMLDNHLVRTDDTGQGPVPVEVPGANTRVEETRFDMLLQDTWSFNDWTWNYGLGAESSTISQSGDASQERRFFFLKPQLMFSWAPTQSRQTRLRIAREVSQLDFNDFVSATVFLDNDLALGNPDLKPESTWVADLTHERRLGELGVVSLTGFYHWISDVQDLLPVTDRFEAPGNIGDGRRWGLELQSTIPLDGMGLPGARMDIEARWQDSSVTDPVTGQHRVLTAIAGFYRVPAILPFRHGNDYAYAVEYRQDLQAAQVAWGWAVRDRGDRPRFKVNELDVYSEEELVVDIFIETTRWWNIKLGFDVNNLLDIPGTRDRTIYAGRRSLSEVERREIQDYSLGRRYSIKMSGSF